MSEIINRIEDAIEQLTDNRFARKNPELCQALQTSRDLAMKQVAWEMQQKALREAMEQALDQFTTGEEALVKLRDGSSAVQRSVSMRRTCVNLSRNWREILIASRPSPSARSVPLPKSSGCTSLRQK